MRIPLVDLRAQFQMIQPEVMIAIETVLTDMQLFLGPETQAFEQEFARYCKSEFGIGCSNGTDALTFRSSVL